MTHIFHDAGDGQSVLCAPHPEDDLFPQTILGVGGYSGLVLVSGNFMDAAQTPGEPDNIMKGDGEIVFQIMPYTSIVNHPRNEDRTSFKQNTYPIPTHGGLMKDSQILMGSQSTTS